MWSTLSYSLNTVGIGQANAAKLRRVVSTHLRAIAQSPRHLTYETSEALHLRLVFPDPVTQLLDEALKLQERVQNMSHNVPECPSLQQAGKAVSVLRRQAVIDQSSHVRLVEVADDKPYPCPHCGLYFASEKAVTVHIGHMHGQDRDTIKIAASQLSKQDYF